MGHLSILIWIKVHHNLLVHTFTDVEFSNFTLISPETMFKIPSWIRSHDLQICSEPSNPLRFADS